MVIAMNHADNIDDHENHHDADAPEGADAREKADAERERELRLANIRESGGITTRNKGYTFHTLLIAGQVEGHNALDDRSKTTKYEHVIPELLSVEENDDINGLLILINTVGGDVEAGLALSELIAGMKTPSVSLVLGGGHSIGVPLAVSADRSFIVPSATMTIHPVRLNGLVIGAPQSFDYFNRMQSRICRFITDHSRIPEEKLRSLMMAPDTLATDIGSVIDGKEAVECGLIDAVGTLSDALDALRELAKKTKENPS